MTKFFSKYYIPVTFVALLAVALVASLVMYPELLDENVDAKVGDQAVDLSILLVCLGMLLVWPRWVLAKLNSIMDSSIQALGRPDDTSDMDFRKRIGGAFGDELVSNIFTYEVYCRNEYLQDMRRYHLAWLMLAVAGAITIVAAFLVIFSGGKEDLKWIQAIGVTLPALVTGVLLKIWLETRANLSKTRARIDLIYRQRLRMLLLVGDHVGGTKANWSDAIALNTKLLEYINSAESLEEARAAGA